MRRRLSTIAAVTASCAAAAAAATPALAASLAATTPPTVTGTAAVGQKLTCTNGTWPAGAGSFTYGWQLADGAVPIGSKSTLKLGQRTAGLAVDCVVSAKSGTTTGTSTSAPVSVSAASPKISITKVTTKTANTLTLTGKITPAAAAKGGLGSLILYRQSSSGPQQLTFNEADTVPASNGTFTLTVTGEPAGRHKYILQYVPGVAGYVSQVTVTRKYTIKK